MIKISSPEILIASSCALICVGQLTAGIVFGSLGILGSLSRAVIDYSVRLEQAKRDQEVNREMRKAGDAVADALSRFTAAIAQRQYDDNDYN